MAIGMAKDEQIKDMKHAVKEGKCYKGIARTPRWE